MEKNEPIIGPKRLVTLDGAYGGIVRWVSSCRHCVHIAGSNLPPLHLYLIIFRFNWLCKHNDNVSVGSILSCDEVTRFAVTTTMKFVCDVHIHTKTHTYTCLIQMIFSLQLPR